MARKRKSNNKKQLRVRRNRPAAPIFPSPITRGTSPHTVGDTLEDQASMYSIEWRASRSGAYAGRGFRFQDAVGAWLVSRLASGELIADTVTPEGFDDLQLDGPEPVEIEVKSRQGSFPIGVAARHIVDAWSRHSRRFETSRRLVVAFEQGIAGLEGADERYAGEIPLIRLVEDIEGLSDSLAIQLASRGGVPANIDDLTKGTSILVCTWEGLTAEMEHNISCVVDLPPAALTVVGRSLLAMVGNAADANAQPEFQNRVSISRSHVIEEINSVAELIDLDAIEQAIVQGICGLLDKDPLDSGNAYYEGMSTQPGHVSANLVVARPAIVSQVLASLNVGEPVLLVGPSGVGKSAALWTVPFELPDVLWFRVHRLSDDDVPQVVRLVKAYRPSSNSRVGLLVDGAGSDDLGGWSRLRQSVTSMQGVLLVGTARNEDIFSLGTLAGCRTVGVSLDETAAQTIHTGLTRRGATTVPHWREAFEQSQGLTLEFAHLLTQGTRLEDVISDQINSRVREGRSLELDILALVAVADRWSASLPVGTLEPALSVGRLELRAALERLGNEHLLVERDGLISGLHQVRSRGIVDVVHSVPPPTLRETTLSVLNMLAGPALSRFIYEVLRELPDLEEPVLRALVAQTDDETNRLVACLRGLELLDFYRLASAWVEIARDRNVPPAHLPLLLHFAIVGTELPEFLPTELRDTTAAMANLSPPSVTRDTLLRETGMARVAFALGTMSTVDGCLRLLRTMSHTTLEEKPLLDALEPGSVLINTLGSCSPKELGDCVEAARDISTDLARVFVEAVGGTDAVLQRFRDGDPWIQELEVDTFAGELVGVVRFLHLSDSEQGSLRDRAYAVGNQLIRALPDIVKVDVEGMLPGGHLLTIDGIDYGALGLRRQFAIDADTVRRNKERIQLAHTLVGVSDTERLREAANLLSEVAALVRDFGNVFVQARGRPRDAAELSERCNELKERGRHLPPRLGTFSISDSESAELIDGISSLVINICSNALPRLANPTEYARLSAFIKETLLAKDIPAATDQPWRFIGLADSPPALVELTKSLSDIDAIIRELSEDASSGQKIVGAARRGSTKYALARASELARHRSRRRVQERRRAMENALRSTGLTVDVFWCGWNPEEAKPLNFAVAVSVETLFDWPTALENLVPKLTELREVGEVPLLVPVLNGKSAPLFAMKLFSRLHSVTDLGEFESMLPEPIEERLTRSVKTAHNALEFISAISILAHLGGQADQVTQYLEKSRNNYNAAIKAIRSCEENILVKGIIEWLTELERRAIDERESRAEAGSFASSLVEGILGDGSQEIEDLQGALMLSLQWDSDQSKMVTLLESVAEQIPNS